MYLVAVVDEVKCIGCKICMQICPEPNAISLIESRKKSFVIFERCKGCGICELKCPKKAISMRQLLAEIADEETCPAMGTCPM